MSRSQFFTSLHRRAARDCSGASALEFAVVLPVLLLLLVGMLSYGLYIAVGHSAAQLAADAARASVAGLDDSERASIVQSTVASSKSAYPLLRPDHVTVKAAPLASDPTEFQVTISYDASELPIWSLGHLVPLPPRTIQRVAVIKRGGY